MSPERAVKNSSLAPRRGNVVDNDGLRYRAMGSALPPSLPTATQSDRHKPDLLLNMRRSKSVPA
jgi:hypothetical protein